MNNEMNRILSISVEDMSSGDYNKGWDLVNDLNNRFSTGTEVSEWELDHSAAFEVHMRIAALRFEG